MIHITWGKTDLFSKRRMLQKLQKNVRNTEWTSPKLDPNHALQWFHKTESFNIDEKILVRIKNIFQLINEYLFNFFHIEFLPMYNPFHWYHISTNLLPFDVFMQIRTIIHKSITLTCKLNISSRFGILSTWGTCEYYRIAMTILFKSFIFLLKLWTDFNLCFNIFYQCTIFLLFIIFCKFLWRFSQNSLRHPRWGIVITYLYRCWWACAWVNMIIFGHCLLVL